MIKLIVRTSDGEEQSYTVQKRTAIVGRGSSCDVIIVAEGVSRQHLKIELARNGACYITDLGSTNGVMLDSKRITQNQPVLYAPFHALSFGSVPWASIETNMPADQSLAAYRNVLRKEDKSGEIQLDIPVERVTPRYRTPVVRDDEIDTSPERNIPWQLLGIIAVLGGISYYFFLQ